MISEASLKKVPVTSFSVTRAGTVSFPRKSLSSFSESTLRQAAHEPPVPIRHARNLLAGIQGCGADRMDSRLKTAEMTKCTGSKPLQAGASAGGVSRGERKNPYLMDSETARAEALEARLRIYRQSRKRNPVLFARQRLRTWMPACAGMTRRGAVGSLQFPVSSSKGQ